MGWAAVGIADRAHVHAHERGVRSAALAIRGLRAGGSNLGVLLLQCLPR
jgi:hypothetical protein